LKPPYGHEKSQKNKEGNKMGEWQFGKLKGEVITKTSCGKGKGDIFCPGE
jgi:hypothetical protein